MGWNPDSSQQYACTEDRGPVLVRPDRGSEAGLEWISSNSEALRIAVTRFGALLLRDFEIRSVSDFNRLATSLYPQLQDYVNRSTPRTKLGGKIYTATEYPADRSIPLHNESSYSHAWPQTLMFYSAVVADAGGQTPVADSRRVYDRIDPAVRTRFEELGVSYVRNYTAGIDLPWQDVFQTQDKSAVDRYCLDNGIDAVWRDGQPELTTSQRRPAVATHPVTGERVWFNQAHLFHPSALEAAERQTLEDELGVDHMPRTALYGDGSPLEPEALANIADAYAHEKVEFDWHQGDVLVVDNLLFAHARNPFQGSRKVVVAMS